MITESQKRTWRQYEAGRNYKRQIGLYSRIDENERFYRGDQWRGGGGLPKPVFNVIGRIVDYLVSTAAVGDVKITYSDENLPFAENSVEAATVSEAVDLLTKNASWRWAFGLSVPALPQPQIRQTRATATFARQLLKCSALRLLSRPPFSTAAL